MVCHYWLFNQGFKFQESVILMLCLNISDIAVTTAKCVKNHSFIHDINKSEVIY